MTAQCYSFWLCNFGTIRDRANVLYVSDMLNESRARSDFGTTLHLKAAKQELTKTVQNLVCEAQLLMKLGRQEQHFSNFSCI